MLKPESLKDINRKDKGDDGELKLTSLAEESPVVRWVSTGCPSVDLALGQGIPIGRVVELFGPKETGKTALCLSVAKSIQDAGEDVVWIDAEYSLVPAHLAKLDPSRFYVHHPAFGEEATDVALAAIAGGVGLVVIDSIPALVPKAEVEGTMEQLQVGALARLVTKFIRKAAPLVARSESTLLLINQTRTKIGVMYGCFHADTPVTFADGTTVPISRVVEERLTGPVLSYDTKSGQVVSRKIRNWFVNGNLPDEEKWLMVTTSTSGGPNGVMSFTCTHRHMVLTDGGFLEAQSLTVGSHLVSWYDSCIEDNPTCRDIVYGSLLGDGAIRGSRGGGTGSLSLANGVQTDYLLWKLDKLKGMSFRLGGNSYRPRYDSAYSAELAIIRSDFYPSGVGYRSIPSGLVLTPLMAAIWYMDDGCYRRTHGNALISIKRLVNMGPDMVERARRAVEELLGETITCTEGGACISIHAAAFRRLCEMIAPYVPECMQYKLLPDWRGKYVEFTVGELTMTKKTRTVTVTDIRDASNRKHRDKRKFDIEVDGTSTYFVGGGGRGVVAHNSNETTPGGSALGYYSSIRARVAKREDIKQGSEVIGIRCSVTSEKNRLAARKREGFFDILFNDGGVDYEGGLLDAAQAIGVITNKSGHVYTLTGQKVGYGKAACRQALKDNPSLASEIQKSVSEANK